MGGYSSTFGREDDKIPHPSSRFFYHPESGWSRDKPRPGSLFQRLMEAEKRDPGNEIGTTTVTHVITRCQDDRERKECTKVRAYSQYFSSLIFFFINIDLIKALPIFCLICLFVFCLLFFFCDVAFCNIWRLSDLKANWSEMNILTARFGRLVGYHESVRGL